jgi:hypothetical protein
MDHPVTCKTTGSVQVFEGRFGGSLSEKDIVGRCLQGLGDFTKFVRGFRQGDLRLQDIDIGKASAKGFGGAKSQRDAK